MARRLETATRDTDFVAIGRNSPNLVKERYSGGHWTGEGPHGRITLTCHNRELSPGLRRKIRLELIAIGLAVLIVAIIIL